MFKISQEFVIIIMKYNVLDVHVQFHDIETGAVWKLFVNVRYCG